MASSENSGKEEKGSLCSETEQTSVPCSVNTFANDGSFMELFKKRMEAESRKLQGKDRGVGKDEGEERVGDVVEEKQDERKAPGSTKTLPLQGKRTFAVGKMGGASKQLYAKKMKKEKDAAEAVKKAEEEAKGKSSAWKAYMEEVKKYKEMSCSDDSDMVRPLVK
ncbi:telomerase RNA component interacting RNase-like [Acropora millepora]|uniref:telomerase RNA component interacting RNase-like n=1 Tax=Acropora millepora TaxID=45264 RepID=UPI001CF376CA|nr:telomerase RNA component interacting RNase-like [Acropora millepora]